MKGRLILRWGGTVAVLVSALVLGVSKAPQLLAQEDELETLMAVLEDPTSLANAIDSRVSTELAQCMSEQGFDYVASPNQVEAEVVPSYGIAAGEARQELVDPNLDILRSLTPDEVTAYEIALYGAPLVEFEGEAAQGSCADQAQQIIEGEIEPALLNLDALLAEIAAGLPGDNKYRAALGDWAVCMRRAGFDLASPEKAEDLALIRFEEAGNGPEALAAAVELERQLAAVDLRCRSDTIDPAVIDFLLIQGTDAAAALATLLEKLEQR
jgi:hypothetical protein